MYISKISFPTRGNPNEALNIFFPFTFLNFLSLPHKFSYVFVSILDFLSWPVCIPYLCNNTIVFVKGDISIQLYKKELLKIKIFDWITGDKTSQYIASYIVYLCNIADVFKSVWIINDGRGSMLSCLEEHYRYHGLRKG